MTLFTANITVTNLVLGDNPPINSLPIVFYWLKACGSTPGLDVTFYGLSSFRVSFFHRLLFPGCFPLDEIVVAVPSRHLEWYFSVA